MFYVCGFLEKIEVAADNALEALNRIRTGNKSSGKKRVRQEMSGIFHTKRPKSSSKVCVWKHKFCCLAFKDQYRSPTTEASKEELYRAGLGDKEITFDDLSMSQKEFHELILEHFPRLRDGGGFRFLKGMVLFFNRYIRGLCIIFTINYHPLKESPTVERWNYFLCRCISLPLASRNVWERHVPMSDQFNVILISRLWMKVMKIL